MDKDPTTESQDRRDTDKTTSGPAKQKPAANTEAAESSAADRPKIEDGGKGPPEKGRTGVGKGFKRLLILVLLALLVGGGYFAWQRYGDRLPDFGQGGAKAPPQKPAGVGESRIRELKETLAAEQEARQELGQRLRADLARVEERLNGQVERLQELSTASRTDWLLAEAEYLLRLANQRLLTERQTANAVALMESADAILRDLDAPDLFPVRRQVAQDLTELRMAEVVDREGLYLRLAALQDNINKLTMELDQVLTRQEPPNEPETVEGPWYRQLWLNARSALTGMTDLIRIQRRDEPLEPLPSLRQASNLRANLQMVLEQAQLALMREEQKIYRDSLVQAQQWVEQHFVDDAGYRAFIDTLERLREEPVAQPLPTLDDSINALQDYIAAWHNRSRPAGGRQ